MSYKKLIDEAESFCAGCSRDRLELRLVDALKTAEAALAEAAFYAAGRDDWGVANGDEREEFYEHARVALDAVTARRGKGQQ